MRVSGIMSAEQAIKSVTTTPTGDVKPDVRSHDREDIFAK
jgi:hypothetical protein